MTAPRQAAFVRSADGYHVAYLLAFEHAAFVEAAYLAVLDRPADPRGFADAMGFLAAGGDKVVLLGRMRYSPEGRTRGVRIRGLRARYWLRQAYTIPMLGYALECLVLFVALPRRARHGRTQAFGMAARLAEVEADATERHGELKRQFADETSARSMLEAKLAAFDAERRERDASVDAALARLGARVDEHVVTGRLPPGLDAFYARFEETFRGSREEIKARMSVYLPWLIEAGIGGADRPVVDLGCGRGEWLELLRERGLASLGVDLNAVCLDALREGGFDVVAADALQYLRDAPDASVGAITGMHIVEHLAFQALVELVDQAKRVLHPGGLLIFETPNPRNVLVASHTFHLDPTHRQPIPSALLKFVLEARGFSAVDVVELHPWTHEWSGVESEFDRYLVATLFGPQDYAVIARKPAEP